LTVAARLRDVEHDVVRFVGTPRGLEARLAAEAGVDFTPVESRGFDRSRPWTLVTAAASALGSLAKTRRIIREFRPDVVVGFGGYAALPLGLAALLARVPLVLHEQNSVPGLANKVLSRWATAVGVTYPDSARYLHRPERAQHTGNPVRASVLAADRSRGRRAFGIAADELALLVFGGSRGARHLNEATVRIAPELARIARLRVLLIAGTIDAAMVRERLLDAPEGASRVFQVLEYVEEMGDALAAADLVVARSGATTIAEITAIGRASVLVPYPYATDDHQTLNARGLAESGGAIVIPDDELDGEKLAETIVGLLADSERRTAMDDTAREFGVRDASERLSALVRGAARSGGQGT
jgi:UDP-N-acetylglucosamine--N-acetylmuramyl-(pentapeptide) pyrophosphoryl-undecaprenol N-acetylglucosamine transferase